MTSLLFDNTSRSGPRRGHVSRDIRPLVSEIIPSTLQVSLVTQMASQAAEPHSLVLSGLDLISDSEIQLWMEEQHLDANLKHQYRNTAQHRTSPIPSMSDIAVD